MSETPWENVEHQSEALERYSARNRMLYNRLRNEVATVVMDQHTSKKVVPPGNGWLPVGMDEFLVLVIEAAFLDGWSAYHQRIQSEHFERGMHMKEGLFHLIDTLKELEDT